MMSIGKPNAHSWLWEDYEHDIRKVPFAYSKIIFDLQQLHTAILLRDDIDEYVEAYNKEQENRTIPFSSTQVVIHHEEHTVIT